MLPYIAKAVRNLAYGAAAVAFPIALHRYGLPPIVAGGIITFGLLAGAAQSWSSGWLSARFSQQRVALASALAMCIGVVLVGTGRIGLLALGALLGGFNVSNQEIGPFAAIEQSVIARQGSTVQRLAIYNAVGTAALALGAVLGAALQTTAAFALYGSAAIVLFIVYSRVWFQASTLTSTPDISSKNKLSGVAERFAALFAVDAFAGGFVVPGFITYWFIHRFNPPTHELGIVIAIANVFAGLSLFGAAWLGRRIGLLRTMVFTHLPSNVLLAAIPFAPTFPLAAGLLIARSALSQMDVPTRQALVLQAVPAEEQTHAAGVTTAVRPAAAAFSPALAGFAMQAAMVGAPFIVAGTLKAVYDVIVFFAFRRVERATSGTARR